MTPEPANPTTRNALSPVMSQRASVNLAPKKELLKLRAGTPKQESSFGRAIQEIVNHKLNLEKRVIEGMYSAGYQVANFIAGNQIGKAHPTRPGEWISWAPAAGDTDAIFTINVMRFWFENNNWKWCQANPDIRARAGRDTDEAIESAEAYDAITDHYERKFWTPTVSQQECLQGVCWGTYVERFRWDTSRPSILAQIPIFDHQMMSLGAGAGMCGSCGMHGEAQDFQQIDNPQGIPIHLCPQCGQLASVDQPPQDMMPTQVGEQSVMLGDFSHELLPFPECRWDMSRSVQDSSWFIHQRDVPIPALHRVMGDVEIPRGEHSDPGLQIAAKLAWLRQGLGGSSGGLESSVSHKTRDTATVIEISLGPDDIADVRIEKDEETLSGEKIKSGSLLNTFPDGLTVIGLNRCKIITGVYREHHSETTVSGVWHSKAMSGTGQGLHDSVPLQRLFNSNNSQINNYNKSVGTPAMLVIADVLDATDSQTYIGTPGMNIPITEDKMGGRKLSEVVAPAFPPMSAPAQFYDYTFQRVADLMQMTSMNTDMAGGNLPGNNPKTKYGQQVKQANAHALFTPPLQIKAETRVALMTRLCIQYPKRFPVERTFMLKGKYSRDVGRTFDGSKLVNDVVLESVKDSELPRNTITKQEDMARFFAVVGGIAGYMDMAEKAPKKLQELEKLYNVQLDAEPIFEVNSLCLQRIRQMQQLAGLIDDPMILLLNVHPPVSEEEPSQILKAQVLADWLDQDDAQNAPQVLRDAVVGLIQIHKEGHGMLAMQQAFQQGQVQTAAAAPMAIGQMAHQAVSGTVSPPPPPQPMGKGKPAAFR